MKRKTKTIKDQMLVRMEPMNLIPIVEMETLMMEMKEVMKKIQNFLKKNERSAKYRNEKERKEAEMLKQWMIHTMQNRMQTMWDKM